MTMIDTSLDAWYNEVKPTLNARQQEVYDGMNSFKTPRTAPEIAKFLNLPLRSVAPRITELKKKGRVERQERRTCVITGGSAYTWRVTKQ